MYIYVFTSSALRKHNLWNNFPLVVFCIEVDQFFFFFFHHLIRNVEMEEE